MMDYAELVIEAALRAGTPEVPARAAHFVTQAERDLEKVMRVRQMEATATLTADADGKAPLPADFSRSAPTARPLGPFPAMIS